MALDPNIALAVRVAPFETRIQSPVDRYARMLSLRQLMQEGETSQLKRQQIEQSIADEATLRGLYAEGNIPSEGTLRAKLGTRAAPIIKSEREAKTAALDTDIKQTTLNLERVKGVGQIVGATTDDASLQQNVALAVKNFGLDPQEGQRLIQQGFGHPATQAALKNLGEQTMTAIQRHEKELKDKQELRAQAGETRAAAIAKPTLVKAQTEAVTAQAQLDAGLLAAAASRGPEALQAALATLPPERAQLFQGATTPMEIYKRGQTPAQRVTSEQAATTAEQTRRHQEEQDRISRGQLGVAQQGLQLRQQEKIQAAGPAELQISPDLQGPDVLKALPASTATQVKAMAEGRLTIPSGRAQTDPYWKGMLNLTAQYDPSFDVNNPGKRAATAKDFSSGKSAQQVNALNTVIGHMESMAKATDDLKNTWSPAWNTMANWLSKNTGQPEVQKFEATKKAVVDELTRVWRGTGGSQHDIKTWEAALDAANSPAQLHGVIQEISELLHSKVVSLEDQYQQGMGTIAAGRRLLTPKSEEALSRIEQRAGGKKPAEKKTGEAKEDPLGIR